MDTMIEKLADLQKRIESLKDNINENDEYDILSQVFAIAEDSLGLITIYNKEQIERWESNEITSNAIAGVFIRKLKKVLEFLYGYIREVNPPFEVLYKNAEVQNKIKTCTQELDEKTRHYELILNEIDELTKQRKTLEECMAPLLNKEDVLKREKQEHEGLLRKKEELTKISEELSKIDVAEIKKEIGTLEKSTDEMEKITTPLTEEKKRLQQSYNENKSLYEEVVSNIQELKESSDNVSSELINNLNKLLPSIDEKIIHIKDVLKQKINELKEIGTKVNEATDYRKEILIPYFEANKKISDVASSNETSTIPSQIKHIEQELERLDHDLAAIIKINQEVAEKIIKNPIFIHQ